MEDVSSTTILTEERATFALRRLHDLQHDATQTLAPPVSKPPKPAPNPNRQRHVTAEPSRLVGEI